MSSITEAVDVSVPVDVAYDQWAQFETFPLFMSGVREVRRLDAGHLHFVVHLAGLTREFDADITELHPYERLAWHSDGGPENAGVITFRRLDNTHTRVTAHIDIDPKGFVENLADKLGYLNRLVHTNMAQFKQFIEEHDTQTGD
ncbi:SRPBCC family protein [Prescottella agglutinans]|uniref:SRPBCC family protein n=1 Tax=Prescottella agglutinans TaxID=1644129 RepID=A0A3S3ZXK5_9NOCA|nr:SRPBCC family protein [Prescottella agglutinans]RVW10530.1 SRPBCC family protein [Prescottella agglutinans]